MSTKTGLAPDHRDGAGGGDERERGRDHLVAGLDSHGQQREHERVGARVHADAVAAAAERRQLGFERRHLGPEDESAGGQHPLGGGDQLAPERAVLPREIDLRDQKPNPLAPVLAWPTPRRLTDIRNSLSWP